MRGNWLEEGFRKNLRAKYVKTLKTKFFQKSIYHMLFNDLSRDRPEVLWDPYLSRSKRPEISQKNFSKFPFCLQSRSKCIEMSREHISKTFLSFVLVGKHQDAHALALGFPFYLKSCLISPKTIQDCFNQSSLSFLSIEQDRVLEPLP